jgi:putative tryptophan/tyrosine transport system substrate-binding protein
MPLIGLLTSRTPGDAPQLMAAVDQGLKDAGFVEGKNLAIAATTAPAALAAKAATTTIPIVFEMGSDPVQLGLVPRLSRPGETSPASHN